jgi:hypothetical protein
MKTENELKPFYNEMNAEITQRPEKYQLHKRIYGETDFRVVDLGWWSLGVLIFTRGSGLLSLNSCEDLASLMGQNFQWLSPFPSIYPYGKNQYIILNCNCSFVSQRLRDSSDNDEENNEDEDDDDNDDEQEENEDDDEANNWLNFFKQLAKNQAYNLTGLDRFKMIVKKPKFIKRKFSLMQIKSTTPEELFQRKLSLEEYGEALQLAHAYKLDSDLVYQKQWRSKPISESTINDYLVLFQPFP